jgi:hypothetical protein
MKLYVASSWRNPHQPATVELLRAVGHEVYDFRHPPEGDHLGFSWSEIDPEWQTWTHGDFADALRHPVAKAGFASDFGAMQWAEAGVLLLPCNRSAHLEAGWFIGQGKPLYVVLLQSEGHSEPELMYSMATAIVFGIDELIRLLRETAGVTA